MKVGGFTFKSKVIKSPIPVLLVCCDSKSPDREKMDTALAKLESEFMGVCKILHFDIDKNKKLAERFGISESPSLVTFIQDLTLETKVGVLTEDEIRAMIDKLLKKYKESGLGDAIVHERLKSLGYM